MSVNLKDELLFEINRVREFITEYESLPNGAGVFGASTMKHYIKMAELSISRGDVVAMLRHYKELEDCK